MGNKREFVRDAILDALENEDLGMVLVFTIAMWIFGIITLFVTVPWFR